MGECSTYIFVFFFCFLEIIMTPSFFRFMCGIERVLRNCHRAHFPCCSCAHPPSPHHHIQRNNSLTPRLAFSRSVLSVTWRFCGLGGCPLGHFSHPTFPIRPRSARSIWLFYVTPPPSAPTHCSTIPFIPLVATTTTTTTTTLTSMKSLLLLFAALVCFQAVRVCSNPPLNFDLRGPFSSDVRGKLVLDVTPKGVGTSVVCEVFFMLTFICLGSDCSSC